ncbi:MAG TPA: alpha/beta hydrolase [Herpetosiphonaceae bacterium]
MDSFITTNGLRLHYLERAGGEPPLILLPGISANARAFDGLIGAGLSPRYRTLAFDLRGRGLSDQAQSYGLADHAADVLGALDALGLGQVVPVGHSFGGLLGFYLAGLAPERFPKLVVLDAAAALASPATAEAIRPALARLGQVYPSWPAYRSAMQAAPFFGGWWDPALDDYYLADVEVGADGKVRPRARPEAIAAVMEAVLAADWPALLGAVRQPVLLIRGEGGYGLPGAPPALTAEAAAATGALLADCRLHAVPGNHMTMLYAEGARRIVALIGAFLAAH